jgi:hypothetical protein
MSKRIDTTIPPGYRLTVTTWENDCDNYNTRSIEGQKLETTQFLVDLLKLFSSKNAHSGKGHGNLYDPSEEEIEKCQKAIVEVWDRHSPEVPKDYSAVVTDEDKYETCLQAWLENLGVAGSNDYYTRVVESFKVEYIPHEIRIADVTAQFT